MYLIFPCTYQAESETNNVDAWEICGVGICNLKIVNNEIITCAMSNDDGVISTHPCGVCVEIFFTQPDVTC